MTNVLLESGTNELEIAEFQLVKIGEQEEFITYGINVAKVREVIRFPVVTDYPKGGGEVVGVFKSRGQVVPLINLAKWLGMQSRDPSESQFVIVTDFNGVVNGFLIDKISRIHRVSWGDLESVPPLSGEYGDDCIVASATLDNKLIFILDFEKIVTDINPSIDMGKYDVSLDESVDLSLAMKEKRSQHSVLIVEDSPFILEQLKKVIASSGFNLIVGRDGVEGWELYEKNKEIIDVVVSDVEMPRMDGLHLCRKITSSSPSIPVIIFSSTMTEENKRKAESVGAKSSLTKPDIDKLIPLLDELLLT
ncbi:chemotaxis protein CheV [Vibrio sp. 10N.222.55.E8]|uniref:chemotaxis protein CheV n=1 Tax=Vibrio artabrorum TaxID=446374 RepID=UPI00354B994A